MSPLLRSGRVAQGRQGSLALGVSLAFGVLVGCAPAPAPQDPPPGTAPRPSPVALAEPRSAAPIQLGPGAPAPQRLIAALPSATLQLPDQSRGGAAAQRGRLLLTGPWKAEGTGRWSTASPARLQHRRYREAAPGVTLLRGDQALRWGSELRERGVGGDYEIEDGRVYLRADGDPALGPPLTLVSEAAAIEEARLHLDLAALPPADFAHLQVTLGGVTRDALLVPAPGSAEYTIRPQAGAVLRFGAGMVQPSAQALAGAAEAQVWIDGALVWSAPLEAGQPWLEQAIPLDRWAGRELRLRLASAPGPDGDPTADWVVFAEPELVPAPSAPPRRVVLVGLDTLRADRLGLAGYARPTTPNLDRIGAQSIIFDEAYAPAPRTRPSFRTLLTGRWPLAAIVAPTLGRRMADDGFTVGGVVANVHLLPDLGFADGAGYWRYHDSALGAEQVDAAVAWLQGHAHEDSFLFLHLMDPHVFYEPPPGFDGLFADPADRGDVPDRFNRWTVQEWAERGTLTPAQQRWISDRYDEEVASLDHQLGRLVAAIDALPGETLIVFASDHGEELWDHGAFEHNHSLHQELVRSVLWVRPPGGWAGGPHRRAPPVSLADVVPSLGGLLGWAPAPADGLDLGPLLTPTPGEAGDALSAALSARPLPLGHLMFNTERWGVVVNGEKYVLETASGQERRYDLRADPGERTDLLPTSSAADLTALRAALATAVEAPVGLGWRLSLRNATTPFTLFFEAPVEAAWVIDPEASRLRRANLEWGEVPPVRPEDVATLRLSEDRRQLEVRPGPGGVGLVAVLGPGPDTVARAVEAGVELRLRPGPARLGGALGEVRAGTLIHPKDSEAARLAHRQDDDQYAALKALGYTE